MADADDAEEPLYIAMGGCGWPGRKGPTGFDWAAYIEKMKADPAYWLGIKEDHEAAPPLNPAPEEGQEHPPRQ